MHSIARFVFRALAILAALTWLAAFLPGAPHLTPGQAHAFAFGANDFRISRVGGGTPFDAFRPAVAYNSQDDEYLVVWESDYLADEEFEIFGQRLDAATGELIGPIVRISDMGPDGDMHYGAGHPAVAYNSRDNEYLVVWRGDDNTGPLVDDELEIFGQRLSADGVQVGENDFRISDMGIDGTAFCMAEYPAVAYNSQNNDYLVIWEGDDYISSRMPKEYEIFGQRLDAAGHEVGLNDFAISDMGPLGVTAYDAHSPALAYNRRDNEYLAVWRGDDDTWPLVDNEVEIFAHRLNGAGSPMPTGDLRISDMGSNGDTAYDAYYPSVAYNDRANEYLVVWQGNDNVPPLVDEEYEIFGQRLSAGAAEIGANDFRISFMGPNGDTRYGAYNPVVTYNGQADEYLVVWWGDDDTSPSVEGEFEIWGQRLDAAGYSSSLNAMRLSEMGPDGAVNYQAAYPAVAYNGQANEYLVVWEGDDDTPPLADGEFEIFGRRLAPGAETPFVLYLPFLLRQ